MFLISPFNKLRGNRFMRRLYKPKPLNRNIAFFVKVTGQKLNLYHKTQTFKFAHVGLIRLSAPVLRWYFFCVDMFSLKSRYVATFKNANGAYFTAPLVEALSLGDKVSWLRNAYKKFFFLSVGVITRLRFLKLATLVSNIGYEHPVFATSFGTYAKIRLIRPLCITIILPSGEWREFTRIVSGIVGRNAGSHRYKEVLGKASAMAHNTKRIIVRSCAKNPVDHPNGGRTRGKRLFKTPWGHPAKSNK